MMKNFRMVIFSLCSVAVLFSGCVVMSSGVGRDRKAQLRQCDMPTVKNGMTRLRQRGKLIKFQCYKGYTLVGSLYAGCVGGKWDTPIPICARSGCPPLTPPENGFVMTERQGIMATFFCREHYKPAGVQTAYCDGFNWDRPIGSCRSTLDSSPRWCDFEVDDLCGWTHDDTHDFEWKRVVGVNNLKKFRTGPQHDHTTMMSNAGHYMLLESVNQLPEDRARLLSPVYSSNLSRNTCFRFYYHMYGATVGTLRIYVKPASIDMDTLVQDQSYLYFEIAGNQKNIWREAVFRLREVNEDFQIVLDGSAGNSHLSDIAVDDVALLDEDQCPQDEGEETRATTEIDEAPNVYDIQSCRNRCDETTPAAEVATGTNKTILVATCDCHPECEDLMTCCPDYRSLCAFGTTYIDSEDDRDITTPETSSKEVEDNHPITRQFPNRPATFPVDAFTKTTSTTTTTTIVTTTTTKKPTTTARQKTSNEPKMTEGRRDQDEKIVLNTTPSLFWRSPSAKPTEYSSHDDQNTSSSEELQLTSQEWLVDTSMNKITLVPTWLIVLLSTFLAGVIILLATFGVIYYRKRYGPENYKKNADNASRNANEEFSEVRFLTCDEQLDFTLQTPNSASGPKT